jgi:hypothetical protein
VIRFVGTSLQLQSTMTAHNQWLSTTLSIPYWAKSVFSSTVTNDKRRIAVRTLNSFLRLNNWTPESESESESELLYDWRFIANHFVLATSPLRLTTSNFIFQQNTCGCSPYVTSSLTRGSICRLQLLLVLVSVVILRSESRGIHDHILLSQIR